MFQWANHVVLKMTRGCNLSCKYCYVVEKEKSYNDFMTLDTFKRVIDRIVDDKLRTDKKINLTFHGGEPTMLYKNTFYNMCEYVVNMSQSSGVEMNLSIQTNLTLVDEEWCSIFSYFGVGVGISWDGINESNSSRNDKTSEFYLDKIKMLKNNGVNYSILMVVNKNNIDSIPQSLKYMEEYFGINKCKINYGEDVLTDFGKESEIEVTGEDFFNKVIKFQIDMFISSGKFYDENIESVIRNFIINYITHYANFKPKRGNCFVKYCGGGINVIEVEPDGTFGLCGRYSKQYKESILSSNYDFLSLNQIKSHLIFQKEKIKAMKKLGCDGCYAQNICDHGCMAFYLSKSKNNGKSSFGIRDDLVCNIFKAYYNYLSSHFDEIVKAYMTNKTDFTITLQNINNSNYNKVTNIAKSIGKDIIRNSNEIRISNKNID